MTTSPLDSEPDGFRRTFVVDVDPQAVWAALTRLPADAPGGGAGTAGAKQCHLPGFEARCSVLEQEPGTFLRVRKDEQPCAGTEIVVRLEHAGSGTRVTVVQSGFGPWLADVIETFGMVWHMIVADLKLFLERGISLETHLFAEPPPALDLGCRTEDRLEGLAVTDVATDGFAARAGIRRGDLLLKLSGVRLLNGLQVTSLMRMCRDGAELDVVWARGRELMHGRAAL